MRAPRPTRAATPVVGIVLLVAVVVVLAGVVTVFALGMGERLEPEAPTISVSHSLVEDGSERTVAITHEGGEGVRAEHLYVTATEEIDVGGPPGSGGATADESFASVRETFDEGGDQVDVGETWDSGETVYVDPVGSVDGVTIRFAWSEQPVQDFNPGTPRGGQSYVIAEVAIRG